ncbi:MAG: TIGR01777 family oxidoreductase [Planctomycetota bacterium]|nr:TIGR01777 family oxidoreductase [Planctomycetota bacterium]MDA1114286.1 TIGR01777 family oxidoreductase [Planctomycetota bacterium]
MGRRILISGASGLVGTALVAAFQHAGDEVLALQRSSSQAQTPWWNPSEGKVELGPIGALDAVIHLAGNSIAEGRWTKAQKERIVNSRVDGTELLCKAITSLPTPPKTLISASAVGFYGNRHQETLDEQSSLGTGFLAEVCSKWESATALAEDSNIRVVHSRIGVVLDPKGGALKKMLTPFRLGIGGRLGPGTQYMSWLSLRDIVGMMDFLIDNPALSGPVNLVSPHPVQNRELTQLLGKALHRPTFLPLPAMVLRALFGEMAEEIFLASTRAVPSKLLQAGYEFQDPELSDYLGTQF